MNFSTGTGSMAGGPTTTCHTHMAKRSHQELPRVLGVGLVLLNGARVALIGGGTQFLGSSRPHFSPGIPPTLRNQGTLRPIFAPRIRAPDEWTQVMPAARPSFQRMSQAQPRRFSSCSIVMLL